MPANFDLIIAADYPTRSAEIVLRNGDGVQIAYKKAEFSNISAGKQRGLFDLRNYLSLYVERGGQQAAIAEIGSCIAEEVLGKEIFAKLWEGNNQRTLRIQLPGADDTENHLATALSRVPWEIARRTDDGETLADRNLLVRVVHDMDAQDSSPIELAAGEPLRVLFVFAEARGSRPLGARKERQDLLQLFKTEIYPTRNVVADFLTYGVTRERLISQIQENNGYHIVHWSGHGHRNLLELSTPNGQPDRLSGEDLLRLFNDAGGFLPRLFFLSACHSGDILQVKDWNDFLAIAEDKELDTRGDIIGETDLRDLNTAEQPGYTGTAHALMQGGVPSLVAMRYAVGDDYARETAVEFYRTLLASPQPKTVAAALTMSRRAMLDPAKYTQARFSPCDHATPVLYGEDLSGLTPVQGRSPAYNQRNNRLQDITELTPANHAHFVGRIWELVGLGAEFIGSRAGAEVKPIAVITGLGGMGKTALAAEALTLWESRFDWVLMYQAKPNRLEFEATLRDIHMKLLGELGRYHDHVREFPANAIYRDADTETGFTGSERLARLTQNLLRALRDEAILIVLDNFETNLKGIDPATQLSACEDPAWDDCLAQLAQGLVGERSRVLITCRRPLAALADQPAHSVLLGPLPSPEAALYLREHPTLSGMVFGGQAAEQALALRLLNASRFHPLLMDRLAKLAALAPPHTQLLAALDALETTKDFAQLPELFATTQGDERELSYLNDALATSLDQLIQDVPPAARRLLWIIALANQPEALSLVRGVWGGESFEQQQLRQVKEMIDNLTKLPPELQAKLNSMPPEIRKAIDELPPDQSERPELAPLLARLVSVGLVTEERDGPDDDNPNLTCHELVRERISAWMGQYPQDRADITENAVRLAFSERLVAVFEGLQHEDMTAALQAGSRAIVYCVEAEAWDQFGNFAGALVTTTREPGLLEVLVPHLQIAANTAPEGKPRWRSLGILADALSNSGRPDVSLPIFDRAIAEARSIAETGGNNSPQAWADLAVLSGNSASALYAVGKLDAARQRHLDSADAEKKANNPAVSIVGSELEALRIDIMQGKAKVALPQVEDLLSQVEAWWQQHLLGQSVREARDVVNLGRALISGLDIARTAHIALKQWPSALRRCDASLEIERALNRPAADLAATRMNRANVLSKLDRLDEARDELEACLTFFQNDPAVKSKVLSSLAALFHEHGDYSESIVQERRALATCENLPDPSDRAISHNNLANYLERGGDPSDIFEAPRHQFSALIYRFVADLRQQLQTSLNNYVVDFRRVQKAGEELTIPRVAELLADPAFAPLEQWLRQRDVDLDDLQAALDQILDQVRKAANSHDD